MRALRDRTALEDAALEKVDAAPRVQQAVWYLALRNKDWTADRALRVIGKRKQCDSEVWEALLFWLIRVRGMTEREAQDLVRER